MPRAAGAPVAIADLAFDPAAAERLRRGRGMRFALREHARTIDALMMREALTRFGRSRLGYLWAVIEPAAFIGVFLLLRAYVRQSVPIGESVVLFLLSGIVAARVVLSVAGKVTGAIEANRVLFVFPLVNPLDAVLGRWVLEVLTGLVVLILFFGGLLALTDDVEIARFAVFTQAVLVAMVLGVSIGTFNAVLSAVVPSWARIWSMLSLPLFVTSGAFLVPATLPPALLAIIAWNPILHVVEWFRTGIYLDYVDVLDRSYPLLLSVLLLGAALTLERVYRLRVVGG